MYEKYQNTCGCNAVRKMSIMLLVETPLLGRKDKKPQANRPVIFSEACVKNSGGSASVHAGIQPPRDQAGTPPRTRQAPPGPGRHPPGPGNPLDQAPPLEQSMLGDTVNEWAVRILLKCILVLHVSVILSTGGSLYEITSCLGASSHVPSGGLCPWSHVPPGGFSVQRGSLSRGSLFRGDPPESEKWAVCIPLECFLVI